MATDEDLIVGIDLGTTSSCVACCRSGEIQVLENSEGDYKTPSFVYFFDSEVTCVGKHAPRFSVMQPIYGIYDIKRLIGRPYNEEEMESLRYLPFDIINDNGNFAIQIKDHNLVKTPEDITAIVLQKIKPDASESLGVEINKAVITVPAHFTVLQRKATLKAAKQAGLTVLKLLNEPTAAILNCLFEAKDKIDLNNKFWLVYYLGQSTFDVTIAKTEDQQRISILCVDGDPNLGGRDFDNLILNYFFENIPDNISLQTFKVRDMRRVRKMCNYSKENLSRMNESPLIIESFMNQHDVEVPFTRQKFEELADTLFKRSMQIVSRCIKKAGLKKQDISEIILAGGSTQIKKIQEMLNEYFDGKPLIQAVHPEFSVAKGAALQAALLSNNPQQKEKLEHFDITEVTSSSLGIADISGRMDFIIKKDTTIPASGSTTHVTIMDQQNAMEFIVYEGEKSNVGQNVRVGTFRITNLTPLPPGKCRVTVTINIDTNGILTVTAEEHHKENVRELEIDLVRDKLEVSDEVEDETFEEFAELKLYFIQYCERVVFNIEARGLKDSLQSLWTQCRKTQKELLRLKNANDLGKLSELGGRVIHLCQPVVLEFKFQKMPHCEHIVRQDILKIADIASMSNNSVS